MIQRVFAGIVVMALLLSVVAVNVSAQNKRTGTAAATELLIPVGARDMALGGATLASTQGIESIHWNPAGLSRTEHSAEAMVSYMSYIADISVNHAAVAGSFGSFGVIGLSFTSLNFGSISLTTNNDPEGLAGRTYSPTFFTVGVTYSKNLTDAIAIGTTMKLVSNTIDQVSSSGIALDFGVQYTRLLGVKGFDIGVAIKNIGGSMKYDGSGLYQMAIPVDGLRPQQRFKVEAASFDLPSLLEIGLGYEGNLRENLQYSLNGSFTNDNLYEDQYRVGAELGYVASPVLTLFGRAGYQFVPKVEADARLWGPAFGVGIAYAMEGFSFDLDFGYQSAKYFDGNSVVSLKFGF